MTRLPIDITLKTMENLADHRGIVLESFPEYIQICRYLTCLDFGDDEDLPFDHYELFDKFKKLVAHALPEYAGREMEFHRICQEINKEVGDII